jgi:hypothetical protein
VIRALMFVLPTFTGMPSAFQSAINFFASGISPFNGMFPIDTLLQAFNYYLDFLYVVFVVYSIMWIQRKLWGN